MWRCACILMAGAAGLPTFALAAPPEAPLVVLGGARQEARLLGFQEASGWNFLVAGQEQAVAASQLVNWGARFDIHAGPVVALADGSQLVAEITALSPTEVTADHRWWGEFKLPRESVRGILFRVPGETRPRDELLAQVMAGQGGGDLVVLENGDSVAGSITGLAAEGSVLQLATKSGPLAIGQAQVLALVANRALVAPPKPGATKLQIGLRDGTLLNLAALNHEREKLKLTLASGVTLVTNEIEPFWAKVEFARGVNERVSYLSDLPVLGYKHVPFLELAWPYVLDRNVLGGRLRAGGRVFEKGIGQHSSSRLAWRIPEGQRGFAAEVALDDAAGREGSVVFRAYVGQHDGKFRLAYESPVVRGGEAPRPVTVDLADGAQLALIVDFADRGDVHDYANWLNARFTP